MGATKARQFGLGQKLSTVKKQRTRNKANRPASLE